MSVIVFFGSSKVSDNDINYQKALNMSELVASYGYDIASGGYGGIMEAALKGAANYKVKRIGVTCNLFKDRVPNDFLSDEIKTKDYFERLELLIDIGDIFVALDGGSGTLLEVSALITLMEREFIDNRKLILFGKKWDFLYSFLENSSVKSNIFFPKDFLQFSEILKRIN
jgi:uncharacterized protein (TIGR00725 family)